ncbi:MAG: NADH-quinone oxidoreductase subunit C [Deltaproteobacteria bacterium]|nr:NADH-quinone oxidoreductase subunit C [Deltaproteobacteria bacterium]MBW2576800.1 NADH-quinone oxidoreductase subunit C [Deltaproteobacteria bacterium]MBW2691656.1 NADH-quinone oxidoreductase subunit C [Deltaproteobacteria bacterium]
MTRDEAQQRFVALLQERFGVEEIPDDNYPLIDAKHHFELARVLREEFGYRIYSFVVASHYLEKVDAKNDNAVIDIEHYEVATGIRCVGAPAHLASWRVRVELDQSIPTLFPLFAGADWQEREQYDLVGVRFDEHPDLRRLMMPEDWEGHPLRKDYAIETACPPWR